ncbi:MAG: DNA-3-methyladenine glycosylase I [Candidatus Kariarchaeaceae archaeon]
MADIIIPPRKKPVDDAGYFEILTKAVFQAGFSWKVVEAKWGGFSEVFQHFDPSTLAKWSEHEILLALDSPLIIRNKRKIDATVENARVFLELVHTHGSFANYMDTIRDNPYLEISKILTNQFKWLGRTGAYFFLWCVEEDVPKWEAR